MGAVVLCKQHFAATQLKELRTGSRSKKLLVAPGITSTKKLLVLMGIAISSKKLLVGGFVFVLEVKPVRLHGTVYLGPSLLLKGV